MGDIRDAAREAYRDFEIDGVPASGEHEPRKAAIRSFAGVIEDEVDQIREAIPSSLILEKTWAALAARSTSGLVAGDGAEIVGDAGTHTDPVVGGTVSNSGRFRWSASPAGWERIAAPAFADQVALAENAAEAAEAVAEGLSYLLTTVTSTNLLDPTAIRDGKYINSVSGNIQSAGGYAVTPFIPVVPGESYTISANGSREPDIAFYSSALDTGVCVGVSDGSTGTRTVVAPPDAAFMAATVKSPGHPQRSWIMINWGSSALPYEPWFAPRQGLSESAILEASGDGRSRFSYAGPGSSESFVESNRAGFGVKNTLVIDPAPTLTTSSGKTNLRATYLNSVLVRDTADDVAPDFIGGSDIGATHGYSLGRLTVEEHGKTDDDRGSVWNKGGVQHVLVDVDGEDALLVAVRASDVYPTTGTFTHVSGATNASAFTATATTGIQWYPPHNGRTIRAFVDGVQVSLSEAAEFAYRTDVKLVETTNLLARSTIIDWWIANGGASAGLEPEGDPVLIVTTTYHFDRDAQLSIYQDWLATAALSLGYLRGLQVGYAGSPAGYYVPGSLQFNHSGSPVNYSTVEAADLTATTGAAVSFNAANLQASGEYGHRLYSLWPDKVFAVGLLPLADAALDVRPERVANVALDIATSNKVYFRAFAVGATTMAAGTRYSIAAFRHIVPRSAGRTAFVVVRTPGGQAFVYADWHGVNALDRLPIPSDLIGRPFTVLDSHNVAGLPIDGGLLTGALPVLPNAPTGYATLVLKVDA